MKRPIHPQLNLIESLTHSSILLPYPQIDMRNYKGKGENCSQLIVSICSSQCLNNQLTVI